MAERKTITLKKEALTATTAMTPASQKAAPERRQRTGYVGKVRSAFDGMVEVYKSAKSYFQAATSSPRIRIPMDVGPNSHNTEIAIIRARSRYAKANHSYYRQAIRQIANNCVGYGIRPVITDTDLQKVWEAWTKEADARGHFDFYGLQWHAVEALATDGEVLFRLRDRQDGDMKSGVPFQIQIMEADHLPLTHTQQEANGNYTMNGVERNVIERVTRYHLYPKHPMDWRGIANSMFPVPVDAADICHIFLPERPTSERGIPWGASVLNTLEFLEEYHVAEVAKKSIQSKITTIFTTPVGEEEGFKGYADEDLGMGNIEIGSAIVLPQGIDAKFATVPDTDTNFEPYNRTVISKIAVAMGMCFELITLDFSKMTDRSYRAMMIQVGKFLDSIVYHLIVHAFAKIWRRFLSAAVLSGAWNIPEGKNIDDFMHPEWMPPPRGHVHPVQEIEALIQAVKAGLLSRQQATAEMGLNALEIDTQNKQDSDRAAAMGLFYSVFSEWLEKRQTIGAANGNSLPTPERAGA